MRQLSPPIQATNLKYNLTIIRTLILTTTLMAMRWKIEIYLRFDFLIAYYLETITLKTQPDAQPGRIQLG